MAPKSIFGRFSLLCGMMSVPYAYDVSSLNVLTERFTVSLLADLHLS